MSDLLNADLTGVSEKRPLLKERQLCEFEVTKISLDDNSKGDGKLINIECELQTDAELDNGEAAPTGFKVYHMISLKLTEKMTEDMIKRQLKLFRHACTGDEGGAFGDVDQYLGNRFTAEVGIQRDKTGQYEDRNTFRKFIPA